MFDITAISETRIIKNISLLNNLNFNNYSFEFTPTETSAGGTLLYIANHLSYKCRNDLNIYKKNELNLLLSKLSTPKNQNIVVEVIYRHPSMDLADFNCNYLNKLLENISKDQKSIFLLGDFNVKLLNYNEHNQTNAPLKRINKYKLKFRSKPWITLGLQKSIPAKNKLLKNFINKKDPVLKEEFHTKYKIYRNLLSTLMKKSKQAYYEKYFERNWNNIKNT